MDATARQQELLILAYFVQNPEAFYTYGDRVKDIHFDYSPAQAIFSLMRAVHHKYERLPTLVELTTIARRKLAGKTSVAVVSKILGDIEDVYSADVSEATGEHISSFVVRRELVRLSIDLQGEYDEEKVSEKLSQYQERLESIQLLTAKETGLGVFPFSKKALDNPLSYIEDLYGGEPVGFGFERLDAKMRGGMRPGELGIILAATGVGKTMFLLNIALHVAIKQRRNVVYYAFDNVLAEMLERVYSSVSGVEIDEEKDSTEYRSSILGGLGGDYNENFLLLPAPANSLTPKDIHRNLLKCQRIFYRNDIKKGVPEEEAGKIALVVIDYGDLVQSARQYKDYHLELGRVFDEFNGLAQRLNVPILTATQGNKESLGAEEVSLKNISYSYKKSWTASFVGALCQTDDEYQAGVLRLAVVKARRPEKNYIVPFRVNYRNMRVIEDERAEITYIKGGGSLSRKRIAHGEEAAPADSPPKPKSRKNAISSKDAAILNLVSHPG